MLIQNNDTSNWLWPYWCPSLLEEGSWGGYFQKNWAGMCSTLPETLTLFQTKICDLPYHISDLIKNLIPYFIPALYSSSLGQTNVKGNVYTLLLRRIQKKVQSFELKIPHYKAGCIMRHHKYRIRAYLYCNINMMTKKLYTGTKQ